MLGSRKTCPNCHDTKLRRVPVNRTIQCSGCKLVLEERAVGDLSEIHVVTQTEEAHFVVPPDALLTNIVDDNPRDPYCTPGFISVFRMLSPLREPVFTTSSRTYSGALAEMERLIGDALFAGYVGYNGRAPGGVPLKKEESVEGPERNKSGGDARHTLVAYFEIVELASILGVDKETINLAVRIFRHTASNTSLRNRNVECLATAAFVAAAERRWFEYEAWMKRKNEEKSASGPFSVFVNGDKAETSPRENSMEENKLRSGKNGECERTSDLMILDESITAEKVSMALAIDKEDSFDREMTLKTTTTAGDIAQGEQDSVKKVPIEPAPVETTTTEENLENDKAGDPWPIPPRHLSLDEISSAANLDVNEVTRYLKVVRIALRKQRPESSSSVTGHMPLFCRRLDLPAKTQKLSIGIAENAMRNNICSRRNPVSISAAAIYLACQMDGVRKTQTEICRATNLTEVTLRKVYKELNREHAAIIPAWYKSEKVPGGKRSMSESPNDQQPQEEIAIAKMEMQLDNSIVNNQNSAPKHTAPNNEGDCDRNLPMPPPLPPGFGEQASKSSDAKEPPVLPPLPSMPPSQQQVGQPAPTGNPSNPLMAMMSNPAMQAFANAFSMMPQLMMPPPPPPLPPRRSGQINELQSDRGEEQGEMNKQKSSVKGDTQPLPPAEEKMEVSPKSANTTNKGGSNTLVSEAAQRHLTTSRSFMSAKAENSVSSGSATLPHGPQNVMAGMQSMLGMMQAMQAFQAMQQAKSGDVVKDGGGSEMNPWAAMASLMQLPNPKIDNVRESTTDKTEARNEGTSSKSVEEPKASTSCESQE
ncbi:unnamed protein product [Agarophyton chilense]